LGGLLGGGIGGACGGFVVGLFAGSLGSVQWALLVSAVQVPLGLVGGLILACLVIVVSRFWKASNHSRRRILVIFAVVTVIAGSWVTSTH